MASVIVYPFRRTKKEKRGEKRKKKKNKDQSFLSVPCAGNYVHVAISVRIWTSAERLASFTVIRGNEGETKRNRVKTCEMIGETDE